MLPIAPRNPMTTYNKATTRPPINWLVDPVPAIKFCSNAESILVAPTQPSRKPASNPVGQRWRTRSSLRGPRHQHCKYDRNENERRHIADQMTAFDRIAEGLNAHDCSVNHVRPHGEPDDAFVSVGISYGHLGQANCRLAALLIWNEISLHSITASASASSVGGTVRFIALAVFRLSTNR
jgi:hypothetical protein